MFRLQKDREKHQGGSEPIRTRDWNHCLYGIHLVLMWREMACVRLFLKYQRASFSWLIAHACATFELRRWITTKPLFKFCIVVIFIYHPGLWYFWKQIRISSWETVAPLNFDTLPQTIAQQDHSTNLRYQPLGTDSGQRSHVAKVLFIPVVFALYCRNICQLYLLFDVHYFEKIPCIVPIFPGYHCSEDR